MSRPAIAITPEEFLRLSADAQSEILEKANPEERRLLMRAYKQAFENAELSAQTDTLTGLLNRRAFERMKTDLVARSSSLALISFDLDHFKKINDTYGHAVGDLVLKSVAEVARKNTRDLAFRLGGEEFIIVAEGVDTRTAMIIAERLRETFTEIAFARFPELKISASIGVVTGKAKSAIMLEALILASDKASYAAKTGGRNRVVLSTHEQVCEILATQARR